MRRGGHRIIAGAVIATLQNDFLAKFAEEPFEANATGRVIIPRLGFMAAERTGLATPWAIFQPVAATWTSRGLRRNDELDLIFDCAGEGRRCWCRRIYSLRTTCESLQTSRSTLEIDATEPPMSAGTAYERVYAEIASMYSTKQKGLEVLSGLRDWLRADPNWATDGYAANLKNGTLEVSYAGTWVLTGHVGDNVIVLEHVCLKSFERTKTEFGLSNVDGLKERIVQLVARAVFQTLRDPEPEPAPRQSLKPLYPV